MMLGKRKTAFDLIIEQPQPGLAPRRLQRFAGFVQSDAPLPPFRVMLGGIEQSISRHDGGDPNAPVDRRHTAYFHFHTEVAPSPRRERLDIEVFAGATRIARRTIRRAAPDDRTGPLTCVLHIPKTAGSSLRLALEEHPSLRVLSLYEAPQFISIASCASVSPTAFDDLDVVFGHFVHGLHRVARRPSRYITLLRHPADLVRSSYLFQKYVVHQPAGYHASIYAAQAASFGTFDNMQTRFVSGKTTWDAVTADDLAAALVNMEQDFAYVGTVEDMATSVRAIGDHLGVSLPCLAVNRTPSSPEAAALTNDEIVERMWPCLEHDMRLYERARELFSAGARG